MDGESGESTETEDVVGTWNDKEKRLWWGWRIEEESWFQNRVKYIEQNDQMKSECCKEV